MIGCTIRRYEHCESTNDEAATWARQIHDRAPHGGVIVTESQSAGRGRMGRTWHSPPGENLYFSIVLRPTLAPNRVPPITLCAGLAVCEVVNTLGVHASIKWPNDVLVDGRKLAGVLTEMSTRGPQVDSVIVGIGINVNSVKFPKTFSKERGSDSNSFSDPSRGLNATSIRLETGTEHDQMQLLGQVLASMHIWVERYCAEGVPALQKAFENYSMLRGRLVSARVHGKLLSGRMISLGDDGSLVLEDESGTQHRVIAGEVQLAEPGDWRDQ